MCVWGSATVNSLTSVIIFITVFIPQFTCVNDRWSVNQLSVVVSRIPALKFMGLHL